MKKDVTIHRNIELSESKIKRFWEKVNKTETCWIWTACKGTRGYGKFGISASKSCNAHRVSWCIAYGPIPDGQFICHKCDNPSCVRPDHLFCGTRQENVNDMMIKKRSRHFQNNEYYGVQWQERYDGPDRKGRWHSYICINGHQKKLAAHTSVLEAARNYDRIAYIKYGERKLLNFPEEYK